MSEPVPPPATSGAAGKPTSGPGPSSPRGGPPPGMRPFGGNRPPREKPAYKDGKPPALDVPFGGTPPKLRDLDADIEAELSAALAGVDQKALMPEPERPGPKGLVGAETPKKKGRVMSIHHADVFIDVPSGRSQGMMPLEQFEDGPPAIGSEVEFDIERYDPANGLLILTRRGAIQSVDWSSVAVGMVVEGVVTGTTKGGLSVSVNGIRGFMPISQIDMYRVEQPEQFINQRLKCAVTEVDPSDRNLVVSRRALLEREREELKAKLWAEIEVGQTRTGTVRGIREFGIFVDLGGADGLVPMSEISWARVTDASQLVSQGQSVQVKVTKIDFEARKIGLSLRQLSASPWDEAPNRIYVGSRVKGKVTRIADFGAFVELEPGVEGLIHISELSPQRVRRVRDVVTEGQEVDVLILSIDTASRRMSLSLKAALAQGPEEAEEDDTPAEPVAPPKPRTYKLRGGTE